MATTSLTRLPTRSRSPSKFERPPWPRLVVRLGGDELWP